MIELRSIDRRVGIVAAIALVLVVVAGAVIVAGGGSDSDDASPGEASTTTAAPNQNGSTPTSSSTSIEEEPPKPVVLRDPIGLSETGEFGTGLAVKLTRIHSVQSVARAPGDVAGPALRVELEATNGSDQPISLENLVVGLEYGDDRTPGSSTSGPNAKTFSRSLAPGKSSTAAYIFRVPPEQRDRIRVVVSYSLDAPTIVFAGSTR